MNRNNRNSMKFICESSVENQIAVPEKVRDAYETYTGYFGKKLRVLKPLDDRMVSAIRKEKAYYIEFLPFWTRKDLDLRLLQSLPELEALTIHSEVPIDWSPIQNLTYLKKLTLKTSGFVPQYLDFCRFKSLHTCHLTWHSEWASILECQPLRGLTIEGARGVKEFLLSRLPHLTEVSIIDCKGLERLKLISNQKIESLAIAVTKSFHEVEPLMAVQGVKYLAFANRTKFDLRTISHFHELRKLWLNGMGKIPSLDTLRSCKKLEYLQMLFSTNIEDGNLEVLTELPNLKIARFQNRRHYSHRMSDINQRPQPR